MKEITYPDAEAVSIFTGNGKENVQLDLAGLCERFVFTLPFWRERANVGFALSLSIKLKKKERITDAEHEALEKGMKLEGNQLSAELNPFYLRCLNAVYTARTINEPPPSKD